MNGMDAMGSMSPMGQAALFEWPLLISTMTIFGTAAFALAVAPAGSPAGEEAKRRVAQLARWLAVISVAVSPFAFANTVAEMAGVPMRAAVALMPEVLHETHAGRLWAWRMGGAMALVAFAWIPGAVARRLHALGLTAAAMLLMRALAGHAIDNGPLAVGLYFVHELAAALWFGALAGLCLGCVPQPLPRQWFSDTVPRVSRVAGWCVAMLAAAGCFTAYEALGFDLDHLLYAAYGRTLMAKLATAAVAVAIGGYNRYWLVARTGEPDSLRALLRNVMIESTLLVAVLGWSALLANTPPPH
jgi:putative copper resistance protein D